MNLFFIHEIFKWINSLHSIIGRGQRLFKFTKILLGIILIFVTLSIYIAFLIPSGITMESNPVLYRTRRILKLIANYHLGVFIYESIAFVFILSGRLFERMKWKKQGLTKEELKAKIYNKRRCMLGLLNIIFIIFIVLYGSYKASNIEITSYDVSVDKDIESLDSLNIVLISDLHMGYNIGVDQISQMVEKVNSLDPDLVILAGDIFDNEYEALENPDELKRLLSNIKSKYGCYGVWGNHDIEEKIIGGFTFTKEGMIKTHSDKMAQLIEDANITMLQEEGILIADSIYLYGRPDYSRPGNAENSRLSPEEIAKTIDPKKLLIVIDHQPRELDELASAGFDLDLGGHTHDGQFFPMNLTSRYITWRNSRGVLKVGNMYSIVTSGVGLFGPNMRIGTIAEITQIRVH